MYIYIYIYIHMCVCIYVCMYVCMCIYIYIYIYIHTYICTYVHNSTIILLQPKAGGDSLRSSSAVRPRQVANHARS